VFDRPTEHWFFVRVERRFCGPSGKRKPVDRVVHLTCARAVACAEHFVPLLAHQLGWHSKQHANGYQDLHARLENRLKLRHGLLRHLSARALLGHEVIHRLDGRKLLLGLDCTRSTHALEGIHQPTSLLGACSLLLGQDRLGESEDLWDGE
jgi:hypothetical protein